MNSYKNSGRSGLPFASAACMGGNRKKTPLKEQSMKYECRITVLETKVFPDLQEKYRANPKSSPSVL
jgi:hypothetical protein